LAQGPGEKADTTFGY